MYDTITGMDDKLHKGKDSLIGMNTDLEGWTDYLGNKFDIIDTYEGNLYLYQIKRMHSSYTVLESNESTDYLGYNAFEGMFGDGGMCNTASSIATALASLNGIRSRHCAWYAKSHAWTEWYIPASICTDGKEHWVSLGQYDSPIMDNESIMRSEQKIFKEYSIFDWVE